ncbi:MAG: methyltransferase domain-containing protein [Melioribacteraceae bacterium]
MILLPGLDKQLSQLKAFFLENEPEAGKKLLVVGSSSEKIAMHLSEKFSLECSLIVEDYESQLNANMLIETKDKILVSLMEFDNTDFVKDEFDYIYAQASVSSIKRNKIIKEFKRILKTDGIFSVGEITTLQKDCPPFVKNIFDTSSMMPLFHEELNNYYIERGFEVIQEIDLTPTLHIYFNKNRAMLDVQYDEMSKDEKTYYKKLINKISHETNAYLRHGADKFIGFKSLILRKK